MIWRRIYVATLLGLTLGYANAVIAASAVSVGYGSGTNDIRGSRFNLMRAWANDGHTPNKRRLTGYWELGFTQMHNPITYSIPTNNEVEVTSGSAVLRVPFRCLLQWYLDIGIGVAYLTNQEIGLRNLGTKWLFEDRLGAGVLLGQNAQYEVGYRLMHYSNAYLAQVNQGVNLHLLILGYWFK